MALGQQLRVLHALDVARTQLYHFMATAIAGMGFFTDAYDFFAISLVMDLISYLYNEEQIDRGVKATINGIALCGAVPGQLVFGWLGDKMGRKRIYGVTLLLMVVTSLASGLYFGTNEASNVVAVLCFFRFWLGFGIGGDYPLSATIMSEYANKRRRGAFIAAVFAMQGFGNLAAGIVAVVVSASFLRTNPRRNANFVWRIVLMLGAVPAILTYYWRMKMPETARYTALVAKDARKAASDMSSVLHVEIIPEDEAVRQDKYGLFSAQFLRYHGTHLLATSACWLAVDITFYSLNLYMKDIFADVGLIDPPGNNDLFTRMTVTTLLHTGIALCGTLPGYFFTVAFVDRIGRVRIQLLGFTMMSVLTAILAATYAYWKRQETIQRKMGFAVLYGLTNFFANFGPNTTTFIVPAEIFPARMRATCHGIAGAFGKIGAIIGVFGFMSNMEEHGVVPRKLWALFASNLVGLVFTFLLPDSKGKSLEEMAGETEEQQQQQDAAVVAAADHINLVPI
ncbi:phosphate transporter 12 [Zea mays]|uniref:H(+)/Pi cotransporter n=1 Tax=Zea mays TaxID=4577 RepID=Q49B42_MAIZE|nr:phosphate transporter 12 [Zea mays]AAY42389.1 inorganic phosphate transporter 5 [Zea mays]|eukprot:NP_001105818.1 phosphate transporter 12 [Zea mays]